MLTLEKENQVLLLVSGVRVASIPVLQHFLDWGCERGIKIEVIENSGAESGYRFVLRTLVALKSNPGRRVIFANVQAAFVLFVAQLLRVRIAQCWYWAFESTSSVSILSPVWLGIYAEKFMRHKNVDLIIPIAERKRFFSSSYRSVSVFENAPRIGQQFTARRLNKGDVIKLVFFGNLNPKITYIYELLNLAKYNSDLFHVTVIGQHPSVLQDEWKSESICWMGRLPYSEMCQILQRDFHFSVVGYKPVDFNYEYCAPNKLFESFSFSLPVIGNARNPTVKRIIEDEGGGHLADFAAFDPKQLYSALIENYQKICLDCFEVYSEKYNFESILSRSSLAL